MSREFLRHTVATLAYRGAKALRGAPPEFSAFRAGPGSRTAGEILAHIGDLLDWGVSLAKGAQAWHGSPPREFGESISTQDFSRVSIVLNRTPPSQFQTA